MRRRALLRAVTGLLIGFATMVAVATPASASPASFRVKYVHAGGAGALAAEASGGFTWYNWSVGLENMNLYVAPNHCAEFIVWGLVGETVVDWYQSDRHCAGSTARNVGLGRVVLDPSPVQKPIGKIDIWVHDVDHDGSNSELYFR